MGRVRCVEEPGTQTVDGEAAAKQEPSPSTGSLTGQQLLERKAALRERLRKAIDDIDHPKSGLITNINHETEQLGDSCDRILIYHSLDLEYF